MSSSFTKKYLAEFIGTFTMVFCGTGAIVIDQHTGGIIGNSGIAATFGLVVMAMIYSIGSVSGAHMNPAVTIAFYLAKKFSAKEIPAYIVAQISGAILASIVLHVLFPENKFLGSTMPSGDWSQSFILEFLLTFFLMFVIMSVAHGSKEEGLFAGVAIGSVVMLEAMFAGPVCGASMNPARSLAPALISGEFNHLWIYLTAPFLGAVCGMYVWRFIKN
ncbi:MAG: MIP family channel protein [Crocinitomicaceae bacterium]|nr:MIP family channel protein [Crocinitomicaceae bacterium]MBK8926170.1 MIP family channel protein [Crocinitomicaceae bacterium]